MTRDDYLHTLRITDDRWDDQQLSAHAALLAAHDDEQRQQIERLTNTNVYLGETIDKWEAICQGYTVKVEQRDSTIRALREALEGMLKFTNLSGYAEYRAAQRVLEETKP